MNRSITFGKLMYKSAIPRKGRDRLPMKLHSRSTAGKKNQVLVVAGKRVQHIPFLRNGWASVIFLPT